MEIKKTWIVPLLVILGGGIGFVIDTIAQGEQRTYLFVGLGIGLVLGLGIWGYWHKKHASSRRKGTIKWFNPNKGFGFIAQDFGEDLFFHRTQILDNNFWDLNKDDRVAFDVGQGKKGLVAKNVRKIASARHPTRPYARVR